MSNAQFTYGTGTTNSLYANYDPHFSGTRNEAIAAALDMLRGSISEGALARVKSDLETLGIHYFPELVVSPAGCEYVQVVEK
jgi:hypothetical protein